MNEHHELISRLCQLRAVLRATKDTLHREVLQGVVEYLERKLSAATSA